MSWNEPDMKLLIQETALLDAAELVSEAMAERDVTKGILAQRLGVGARTVHRYLTGETPMTVDKLALILHAMGYGLELRKRIAADGFAEATDV